MKILPLSQPEPVKAAGRAVRASRAGMITRDGRPAAAREPEEFERGGDHRGARGRDTDNEIRAGSALKSAQSRLSPSKSCSADIYGRMASLRSVQSSSDVARLVRGLHLKSSANSLRVSIGLRSTPTPQAFARLSQRAASLRVAAFAASMSTGAPSSSSCRSAAASIYEATLLWLARARSLTASFAEARPRPLLTYGSMAEELCPLRRLYPGARLASPHAGWAADRRAHLHGGPRPRRLRKPSRCCASRGHIRGHRSRGLGFDQSITPAFRTRSPLQASLIAKVRKLRLRPH